MKNKYGLSRYVPVDVRRVVRKRCGFGCVICGLAYYDFEHFDPDFSEAREHNPDGMTLLCSQCNQKRARGRLSVETVARANANPKCLEQGYSNEVFDFHSDPIEIRVGGAIFYNCWDLIVINNRPILSIRPPVGAGAPMRLSGVFCGANQKVSLKINSNEFELNSDNWDVDCTGGKITIESDESGVSLVVRMLPPAGLVIEKIEMNFQGVFLSGDADDLRVSYDQRSWITFSKTRISDSRVGIAIENGPVPANDHVFDVDMY
ncbi:hypothetical protein [Burkholderia gladioli]|uniref:hypothetical protein n=1 Tax=Burkholderia gladioli TaxID=28095 RepID=UPI001640554E|nr:hypothetical protein [Burkholderia gladioli]